MNIRIVLIAFNRPIHTQNVLESLRSEGVSELTIFIDGAEKKHDVMMQKELYTVIQAVDWANIEVVQHDYDLGLENSISFAVSSTLKRYDAVIVLEDDCIVQKGFKNFMYQALNEYKDKKKVRSICSFTYPCLDPAQITGDIFFIDRFCPWGWATWKDRWVDYDSNFSRLAADFKQSKTPVTKVGQDIYNYCSDARYLENSQDIWSLNWILTHYLTNTLAAYPRYSLINNIGFDGSGVHSGTTDVFDCHHHNGSSIQPTFPLNARIQVNQLAQKAVTKYLEQHSWKTMEKKINSNPKKLAYG